MSENVEKKSLQVISQATPVPCKIPGLADVVGFGAAGVEILRNRIDPHKELAVAAFGQDPKAGGWSIAKNVRLVADTTGDGQADVVGFGQDGVYLSLNKGTNTFDAPKLVSNDFGYNTGWRVDKHIRFMADIKLTGRADIVGFGTAGTYVSLNHGNSVFGTTKLAVNNFGLDQGWDLTKHLRFLADVNGNGLLDIVGFGQDHVWVALNNGDGTFQTPHIGLKSQLCFNQGWKVDENPRFLADLTGDGKVDIVGFGDKGVYAALNRGDGTFHDPKLVVEDFSPIQGWSYKKHVRTVADITGNKVADIVGFGEKDVIVAVNKGDGTFEPTKAVLAQFTMGQGWDVNLHPRFVVDITGDGRADIVGFGANGIWVSNSAGKGDFTSAVEVYPDFGANNPGWSPTTAVKFLANLYAQ